MVSYAIVFRHGLERYVHDAREAGFAGAIIPDLPVEESADDGPHLPRPRLQPDSVGDAHDAPGTRRAIARTSTGFLYYVSVTGITGERREIATGGG